MEPKYDIKGQRFGRLKAIKFDRKEGYVEYWLCECECGNQKIINGNSLRYGKTKSCGCLRREAPAKPKKKSKGGIFYLHQKPIETKNKHASEVKVYKLSPKKLEAYLEELKTKEVQYKK